MPSVLHIKSHEKEKKVVTKALKNAADLWDISNKQLGKLTGLSEATVSRLKNGQYLLKYNSKEWELALIFLRVFRGLDAYMGGHMENEKAWLKADNTALGGIPIELIQHVEGLANVVQYVDYMRGQ